MNSDWKTIIFMGVLILLSILALSAWLYMPIYPDEVAFQLLTGRYIPDHGIANKLFFICSTNAREIPLLFKIPALVLSWMDLHFSLVVIRILPFVTTIVAISLCFFSSAKQQNIAGAMIGLTGLIGVSGSGLIISRPEYIHLLNIVFCLWVFLKLESTSYRNTNLYIIVTLLFISCLFSIYAHLQGLIFLPLTLYLGFRAFGQTFEKGKTAVLMTAIFIFVVSTKLIFESSPCPEYPGISNLLKEMTFNLEAFESIHFMDWMVAHFRQYSEAFIYKKTYPINYLPGIDLNGGGIEITLAVINKIIRIVVLTNGILFMGIAIAAFAFIAKRYRSLFRYKKNDIATNKDLNNAFIIILFSYPLIFLFFYDSMQGFYRTFFINFLVSIMVSIVLSRKTFDRFRKILYIYCTLCCLSVLTSIFFNVWWFANKFYDGFEGPSMSIKNDWEAIDRDVMALAKACDMDLTKGKIIIDDMTYGSLKHYPSLYPLTYLQLSSAATKLSNAEILNIINPNYAIVRCGYFPTWGVVPQISLNQLCAVNFLDTEHTKKERNYNP